MIARTLILASLIAAAAPKGTLELQAKRYRVGPDPVSIALADMNSDGTLDMLVANRGRLMDIRDEHPAAENVSLLLGRQDHTFDAQPPLPCGFGPYQVVVANIDALKAPDIVVANFHAVRNRDLTLLRNLDNVFEPHNFAVPDDALRYSQARDSEGKPIFSTPGLTSVAIADFNADGLRDAIATGWSSDVLVFFPGRADTYFGEPSIIGLPGGPRDLLVEDFDADGALDLAVTLYNSDEIALLRGNGKGEFNLADRLPARGKMPQHLRAADIDGDRHKDLIVTFGQSDDAVVIFFGDGGFSFSMSQEYRLGKDRFKREYGIQDVIVRDFNGDDKPDLAVACADAGSVVLLKNTTPNKGVPLRFDAETYAIDGGQPHALAAGDINGDGRPDLAVALWGADAVALLFTRP